MTATDPELLSAPHVLEFPYTRSLGPANSAFFTGLRDRQVVGIRDSSGRVLVPPLEYDPLTHAQLDATAPVPVGPEGTVATWSWNPVPRLGQPLEQPFAWVLVQLDGADTPMLHALEVDSPDQVSTGMRVRARWAAETVGRIQDIACFVPVTGDHP